MLERIAEEPCAMPEEKPYLWIIDSPRKPLAACLELFDDWADIAYIAPGQVIPEWDEPPDAVFFSAEIAGGAEGELFTELCREAGATPLLAVARLRSLAQAVAYFRAGATDYLPLPLDEDGVRERLAAALLKMARQAMQGVTVELEPVDPDADVVSLSLSPSPAATPAEDEDILAQLPDAAVEAAAETEKAEEADAAPEAVAEPPPLPGDVADDAVPTPEPSEAADAAGGEEVADGDGEEGEDEPEAVDGLPIPTLWEELPCGLLVFDSSGNLVFSNSLGLDLFGYPSTVELEEALEFRRADFQAYGANRKPLPDNQWPQELALKSRTARSAVISIEKGDRRRQWLRIDCLPHLADGRITRLTMTIVNLTGELPPLVVASPTETVPAAAGRRAKAKTRGGRRR